MAALGWIDFSPTHRNRVGSVLDLLRPEGMVDELGMGTLRDSIANELFPGISTIQTRAKYFFIIPYILWEYQALKPTQRKGRNAVQFLEQEEYEIMWGLAEHYKYVEGHGVIGISKRRKEKIVRRPSAIYWNGLNTYKFIDSRSLATTEFLRKASNTAIESLISDVSSGDDDNVDDVDLDYENIFRIKVPPNVDWREGLTPDLTKEEAEYFADKIISMVPNKTIAELLLNQELWNVYIKSDNFNSFAKTAIRHNPRPIIKSMLTLAHDFSELMYGAHLAYNCQLQNKVFSNSCFNGAWIDWINNIKTNLIDYSGFDPDQLLPYSITTREKTLIFVRDWWDQTKLGFPDIEKRDKIIQLQEAVVKGRKARLQWNKTNDVREKTWIGLSYFDYRFGQGGTILKDIKTGLEKNDAAS